MRYAGRKHPDSGVVFDHKGFPIFDDIAKHDTRLNQKVFYATDRIGQMRMATRDLREQINSGKISRSQFSPEQLKAIQSGRSKIPEYTYQKQPAL
ncbi:HNH endonuclease [Kingella denitrificans]|uniref:HNH endonuclease n=1 Tax=Kingella denitrificans TaxID=502 RepID=UPI0002EE24F6|nr:HNH endonuclease [Kingella denitrificans]QQB42981.1 HNH endonuclease [Kingella denitrificans]